MKERVEVCKERDFIYRMSQDFEASHDEYFSLLLKITETEIERRLCRQRLEAISRTLRLHGVEVTP